MFADIDMLEIGTDSDTSPPGSPPVRAKSYPTLREWMEGASLRFQYDGTPRADASPAQAAHVTRLYKAVEALGDDEPIGVDLGREARELALDAAFTQVVASTARYADECGDDHSDTAGDTAGDNHSDTAGDNHSDTSRDTANGNANGNADADRLADLCVLVEAVWAHLFVRSPMDWINRFDPRPDNALIDDVMYNTLQPAAHPQFWPYVVQLVLRGMNAQAAQLLRALACSHPLVADVAAVLDAYAPMVQRGQFALWKVTVCDLRDSVAAAAADAAADDARAAAGLRDVLRVLSGLPKTIAAHAATWYDMYGALSLYQVWDGSARDHAEWFALAVDEKGANPTDPLEQALCDLMRARNLRVVLAIDRLDLPTAAYVSRLMDARGCFADYAADPARRVSDYLLTRHAYECLETHSLVPVAAGLLLEVVQGPAARDALAHFLPHYVPRTNDDMEWALTLCSKLALPNAARHLYVSQGKRLEHLGHLYEAMAMYARAFSRDCPEAARHLHHVAWDLVFQHLLLASEPLPDKLLANVVANNVDFGVPPAVRQCLAPYAVWAQYLAHAAVPDLFVANLSRLYHLLRFAHMPPKFVPLLLARLLPMFPASPFRLPDLIVAIELLDTFERRFRDESCDPDIEELYLYALEALPVPHDWRAQLAAQDVPVPPSVDALMRDLRERIVAQIGRVYVGAL